MKLLLHACCGPCACYPAKVLSGQGVDFTLLYYNPNIHPYKEFKHRLSALRELSEKQDYRLIIDKTYPDAGRACGTLCLLLPDAVAVYGKVCGGPWLYCIFYNVAVQSVSEA